MCNFRQERDLLWEHVPPGSAVGARASLLLHVQARGSVRDDQENCLASREAVQKADFPSYRVMAWALADCRKLGEVSGRRLLLHKGTWQR